MFRSVRAVVLASLALASCRIDVTGAPCSSDDNCPLAQHCDLSTNRCVAGAGSQAGDAGGGTVIAPVGCMQDEDCLQALAAAATSPVDCAEGTCDLTAHRCAFRAKDRDGDGERAAKCSSATVAIVTGPDCDDTTVTLKAGSMQPCTQFDDGGLLFPAGMPVGKCVAPVRTCDPGGSGRFSACVGGVLPTAPNCTSTDDFTCNGVPDSEDCGCTIGSTRACYSGPSGTRAVGLCTEGVQTCFSLDAGLNGWGACTGDRLPTEVECSTADDSNCNGRSDAEDCGCQVGGTRPCYPEDGGVGVGVCVAGVETCALVDAGTAAWGACTGAVTPRALDCSTNLDNDCDGTTDDVQCGCQVGTNRACYLGPSGTAGIGICRAGTQSCQLADAGVSTWSACTGQVLPGAVNCSSTTVDNNCNGQTDAVDCGCQLGATRACYTGPSGTQNVGQCRGGTQTCISTGAASTTWGTCTGQVVPTTRNCTSSTADADCNGQADVIACGCQVNTSRSCYTGPSGTANVGSCRSGTQTCNANGVGFGAWGGCTGQVTPAARDTCNANEDNDCSGVAGNGCTCYPVGRTDSSGCPGTCTNGTRTCLAGGNWGGCSGQTNRTCSPGQTASCGNGGATGCSAVYTCNGCFWSTSCTITSCTDINMGSCAINGCVGGLNPCTNTCSLGRCPAGTSRSRVDWSGGCGSWSVDPNPGNNNWTSTDPGDPSFNMRLGGGAFTGCSQSWTAYCRGPR